jgi:hypothetical protein
MDERESQIDLDGTETDGRGVDAPGERDAAASEFDATDFADDAASDADLRTKETNGGVRDRIRSRVGSVVSSGGLIATTVASLVGIFLVGAIPLLGSLPLVGLVGVAVGTFFHGLFVDETRYIEAALAGAIAGGGSVLLSYLFLALLGTGGALFGLALVVGALAGAAGHYFGRDLRAGLTRDLE